MNKEITVQTNNEGNAAVNIEKTDKELQDLIEKLAKLSIDKNVRLTDIVTKLSEERRLYIESLNPIPEENEDEKAFRKKAEKFFEKYGVTYFQEKGKTDKYVAMFEKFHILVSIEIACTSYKIYKKCGEVSQKAIYEKTRERIPLKPKSAGGPGGSRFEHVQRFTSTYLKDIVNFKLEQDEKLRVKCSEFLSKYTYRKGIEENMLKLICIIENYSF